MIKPKLILILAALLLAAAAALRFVPDSRPPVKAPDTGGKLFQTFNIDTVKAVEIKKGGVGVKIEKKDSKWILTSHKDRPASSERVNRYLLDNLKKATIADVRTAKSDEVFGLDEKERTELTLHNETGKSTLYLGKVAEGKTFVRHATGSGPAALLATIQDSDAGISPEPTKDGKETVRVLKPAVFYDLGVFKFNADDVIEVVVKKGHEVTRVQKVVPGKGPLQAKQEAPGKDDPAPVWWITEPEGFAAEEHSVRTICSNIAGLNAKSYADDIPEKDRGLDKPLARLKLVLKDGSEYNLAFGAVKETEVVMSAAGKSDAYTLFKYVYDSTIRDLKKKEEKKKDTEKDADESSLDPIPGFPAIPGLPPHPATPLEVPKPTIPPPVKQDKPKLDETKK